MLLLLLLLSVDVVIAAAAVVVVVVADPTVPCLSCEKHTPTNITNWAEYMALQPSFGLALDGAVPLVDVMFYRNCGA